MKVRLLKLNNEIGPDPINKDLDCFFENDDTQTNFEINDYESKMSESPIKE